MTSNLPSPLISPTVTSSGKPEPTAMGLWMSALKVGVCANERVGAAIAAKTETASRARALKNARRPSRRMVGRGVVVITVGLDGMKRVRRLMRNGGRKGDIARHNFFAGALAARGGGHGKAAGGRANAKQHDW